MILLLVAVSVLYAGYNVLIKMAGNNIPKTASTPVLASLCLQVGALSVSFALLSGMAISGNFNMQLTRKAYIYAGLAGVFVGLGGYGYFHLFSGFGLFKPMEASVAIPVVVCSTIVISMIVSAIILKESIRWTQLIGAALILSGIVMLFIKVEGNAVGTTV